MRRARIRARCPNCRKGKGVYRYKIPLHYVECSICGVRTGYHAECGVFQFSARDAAVKDWNEGRVRRWENVRFQRCAIETSRKEA